MLKLLKTIPQTMATLCVFSDGSKGWASTQYDSLLGMCVKTPAHTLTPKQEKALEEAPDGLAIGELIIHHYVYPEHPEFDAEKLAKQKQKKTDTCSEFITNSPESLKKVNDKIGVNIRIPETSSPYNAFCALKEALPHDFAVLRLQDRKLLGEFIRIVNTRTKERLEISATGLLS